jgi:hypothetical protein
MQQNQERSGSSQRLFVDDDEGLDVLTVAPRQSSSNTPINRRVSPLVMPTGRITNPAGSDTPTAASLTYESLARRPRSNPRTRTPMRYESPLNANAFRRDNVSPEPSTREGQRVSLRPLAGAAIGTNLIARIVSKRSIFYSNMNCTTLGLMY